MPFKSNFRFLLKKSGIQNKYTHQIGSVKNFPRPTAQACRSLTRVRHGTGGLAGSEGSLLISANSLGETSLLSSGRRYRANQAATHRKPIAPVPMKAIRHPNRDVSHRTTMGVTIAPTFVPELKMPGAIARSFFGNHSATALIEPGKLPASPMPRLKRAAAN